MNPQPAQQPPINPYFILGIGVIAVSFSAILVRMTVAAPAVIACYRLLITCLILSPLAIRDRAEFRNLGAGDFMLCFLSGLFLSFHFVFWFTSLGWTSVSSSTLMVNIHPLLVVSAGWILFGEKINVKALPWMTAAVAGMAVLGWGDLHLTETALSGNLLAAAGGLMLGCYYLVGRKARVKIPISIYSVLVYGSSALLLLIYNILAANPLSGYSPGDWLTFAALALIPTIFGHTFVNWSLKYLPAGAVSVSVLGEPVIATALAIPLLREVPGPIQMAGGILVIGGIWMFLKQR